MWRITEKIDGMNMRVIWDNEVLTLKGRTDNAQIPKHLQEYLFRTFNIEMFDKIFSGKTEKVILYGEGYGKKIQSDKYKLKDKVRFILFDVWVEKVPYTNLGWWLEYDDVKDIANKLDIDVVPQVGFWNDSDTINNIRKNPNSKLNNDVVIEGYVATSYPMVMFRDGTPVRWKIKVKDYIQLRKS